MSKIKICGLKRIEDIEAANLYKPDYVGFVMAPGRRQVTEQQASHLKKSLCKDIKAVGVFVNEKRDYIAGLLEGGIIDIAQLHGEETEEDVVWLKEHTGKPVIKAVSVKSAEDIRRWRDSSADYLLLDNGAGGTGKTFDWNVIGDFNKQYFLAGGLNGSNIADALKLNPYCVDISGGVETDGYKDADKIKQVIDIVRRY